MKLRILFLGSALLLMLPSRVNGENGVNGQYFHQPRQLPSRILLYASTAADLATTEVALKRGYIEGNPILGQNRYRRIGIAIGGTVAADLCAQYIKAAGHPKAAIVLRSIISGVHFGVAYRNLQVP